MNTKKVLKKRVLSALLAVIMVLSVVPLSVFAADYTLQVTTAEGDIEQFNSFEEAIRYAGSNVGSTVKLLEDITVDDTTEGSMITGGYYIYFSSGNYTIDLAGKTLTSGSIWFGIQDGCNLTISDSVGGGKFKNATSYGETELKVYQKGKLTITGGDFVQVVVRTVYVDSDLEIKGGSFHRVHSEGALNPRSVFEFLADGYAFMTASGTYANETDQETTPGVGANQYSNCLENVSVVPAPFRITEQPADLIVYLTSPEDIDKNVSLNVEAGEAITGKQVDVRFEKTDGTEIAAGIFQYEDFDKIQFSAESLLTDIGSGEYRIRLQFNDYILYSRTFTVALAECEHPGYDESTHKCSQCSCDLSAAITNGSVTKGYVTADDAVAAAQTDENSGCTLTLLDGNFSTVELMTGKLTFENKGASVRVLVINNGADVTIASDCSAGIDFESGKLTIADGNISGDVLVGSVGEVKILGGEFSGDVSIAATDSANVLLSGGSFAKLSLIQATESHTLREYLADKYVFADKQSGKVLKADTSELENVTVIPHNEHNCVWNTSTHEKVCDCGYVAETDNEPPTVSGIADGGTYYGDISFTVSDKNSVAVKDGSAELSATDGVYTLAADNQSHTVNVTDIAGNTVSLTVNVMKIYSVTLSVKDSRGNLSKGAVFEAEPTVGHGQDYSFKVTLKDGYTLAENYKALANSNVLVAQTNPDGILVYTVSAVQGDLNIVLEGVDDTTPPKAEITVGTKKFTSFMNSVTFGLFFKDRQAVEITADDNSGDAVKIEYLLSTDTWTKTDLETRVFTDYIGSFNIDPDKEYIIYVRVTDEAGNVDYISSDGIVIDSTAPVIGGIENGKTYCQAQTVTVDEKYIASVTVNGAEVTLDANNQFVLSPMSGTQQVVVTDKAGNTAQATVTVNDGHTYGEWQSNGNGKHFRVCTAEGCTASVGPEDCHGGKASCRSGAVCDVCKQAYGESDANSHIGVAHISAKAAIGNADGNIEYWHCEDCDKYFSDSALTKEITQADTVIKSTGIGSSNTGDNCNIYLWVVLLFVSGGAVIGTTVLRKKKKYVG